MNIIKRIIQACCIIVLCFGLISARPLSTSTITINVTTAEDEFDTEPNTGCSLREAIQAANTGADFGGCTYSGEGDVVINLGAFASDLSFECTGADDNSCGDMDITTSLTIQGVGIHDSWIFADRKDRIFDITGSANVTINDISLNEATPAAGEDGSNGVKLVFEEGMRCAGA